MSFRVSLVVILSIFFLKVDAQITFLSGKINNEKSEPLSGVSVQVVNGKGTSTSTDGSFRLSLDAGKKYELNISAIGYESRTITEVEVKSGEENVLNIILQSSSRKMEDVVVQSKTSAKKESINSIISFQRNTNTVASVISAESIKRSPDKNTGEILKRIPGTSIQEGKYLVVRGLSDRYNQSMLNGVQLSSTEPDRKTFSFDIFPSSAIENIVINKAFVPEHPGEWAGGLVQITTKTIPVKNFLTIQLGSGFNTQTAGKDFYNYDGGKFDWLGFDDGSRGLPNAFPVKSKFSELSNADKVALGKQIAADKWSINQVNVPMNSSMQISAGLRSRILGKDAGALLAVTYSKSHRNLAYDNSFYSFESTNSSLLFDYSNNKYSVDVLAGGLANFSVRLNNDHQLSLKNILTINASDFTTLRRGFDFEQDPLEGDRIRARELGFRSNTFYNSQLSGEHNLRFIKSTVNWYGSFSILDAYVPKQRRMQYNQENEGGPYRLLISESKSQKTGSVFYSMLSDYIYNAGGDIKKNFKLFNTNQSVKAGYLFQVKDRLFDSRPFSIYLQDGTSPLRLLQEEQVFAAQNFDADDRAKFQFDEIIGKQFRYVANSILNAFYLQADNRVGSKLRIVWGARYEHFDQVVGSLVKSDERHAYSRRGDLLPAINATYKIDQLTNIRLSASQTVIRPEFRELTNFAFYDFDLGAAVVGKSDLKRTNVTNVDLRYEIYPRAGELFTIGVFAKHFKNPIELYFNQSGVATNTFNFLNVARAKSYGAEAEFRKRLDFIKGMRNFTMHANVSYIYNQVEDALVKINRPMQGQSPYLLNAGLQYDVDRLGLNTTLLFNQVGRRILYVGNDQIPAIWEAPRPLFDLQLAKKLFKTKGEVKLNISDILNKRAYYYHDMNSDNRFTKSAVDRTAIIRNFGTGVSMTFSYNIQ